MCSFLLAYVDCFFDSNPKLRQLSQLYIEEIRVLMCKFGGYDNTILLQRACDDVKRLELRTTIQCSPFADAQEEWIIGQ